MPFGLPSEAASIAILSFLLTLAMLIGVRGRRSLAPRERVLPPASAALALQSLHVGEEFWAGFHREAPALFGLQPWAASYFVWVNMGAIALWSLALGAFASGRANAFWGGLLWFLAIASIGNGIWHPAASLATGAYFAGTATALPLGLFGVVLVRALRSRSAVLDRAHELM